MNERIQKMMNDSRPLVAMESLSSWDELQKYADDWTEKFAELIVRECVKVMYDNAIERKVPPDINKTPTHYAIAVLEHFGVEE